MRSVTVCSFCLFLFRARTRGRRWFNSGAHLTDRTSARATAQPSRPRERLNALVPTQRSAAFRARRAQRLENPQDPVALSMGLQRPRVICARVPGCREAGDRISADSAERHRRWSVAEYAGSDRTSYRSARVDRCLWRLASFDVTVYRAARVFLRQGNAGRHTHAGTEDVSPSAFAVDAVSPRSAHRRRHARDRPGHSWNFFADQLYACIRSCRR